MSGPFRGADKVLSPREISGKPGTPPEAAKRAPDRRDEQGTSPEAVKGAPDRRNEQGTPPEEAPRRGYRRSTEPDRIREEELCAHLRTDWAGGQRLILDTVDSTNSEAKRQAEAGAEHGLLVVSEGQTAGRGRRGRTWESAVGESIYMTLLLRPEIEPGNASMLTLVMALAVRRALAEAGVETQIKWPNDIVRQGKKLAGILTEMKVRDEGICHMVIGVGINVNNASFGEGLEQRATSVFLQTGKKQRRAPLVARVLRQFEDCYDRYIAHQDLRELMEEYNGCLVNCGREVRVLDPKQEYTGRAMGINARGELCVLTGEGIRTVSSGEVSVRGVYGYV